MMEASQSPLRVLIVEDERPARELLCDWLSQFPEIKVVAAVDSLKAAKENLISHEPDIVFLDIELPDGTGFNLFDDRDGVNRPYVVFTTAYDAYAAKAFRVDAIDYLVKPFDKEQLAEAVDRIIRRFHSDAAHALGDDDQFRKIIRIKHRGQTILLMASDIEYLKSEDYYTAVHTCDRQYLSRTALKVFRKDLVKFGFVQIHRSYIINIAHVTATKAISGGDAEVMLRSGLAIRMSRRYKNDFQNTLQKYSVV